jgi:transposase
MERRQRRSFTDNYKRQAVNLVASSGRSIGSAAKKLGLRDRFCGAGGTRGWARADGGGVAPDNAGDVGGPCRGDRPFAAGERAAAHGSVTF